MIFDLKWKPTKYYTCDIRSHTLNNTHTRTHIYRVFYQIIIRRYFVIFTYQENRFFSVIAVLIFSSRTISLFEWRISGLGTRSRSRTWITAAHNDGYVSLTCSKFTVDMTLKLNQHILCSCNCFTRKQQKSNTRTQTMKKSIIHHHLKYKQFVSDAEIYQHTPWKYWNDGCTSIVTTPIRVMRRK